VTQTSGAYLNGNGADWWDGEGSNGGKTKPKFFYAHNLISSTISDIYILNSPVQVFSIDDSTDLTLTDITIDDSAGSSEGANTDCFDIGSSTGITITGAECYNQDDCVAVNSGTVSAPVLLEKLSELKIYRASLSLGEFVQVDTVSALVVSEEEVTTLSKLSFSRVQRLRAARTVFPLNLSSDTRLMITRCAYQDNLRRHRNSQRGHL